MSTIKTTQTAHPVKAAIRTMIETAIPTIMLVAYIFATITEEMKAYLPEAWGIWLLAASSFLISLAGLLTVLAANKQVNAFLTRFGLGATPKDASTFEAANG